MTWQRGEKNPCWKGDNVGRDCLHKWVRRHLTQPELCQICYLKPSHDLANITGIYDREFNNWKYLCRRCHMLSDGRMKNLFQYHPIPIKFSEDRRRSISLRQLGKRKGPYKKRGMH